jgi:hypothetical protein
MGMGPITIFDKSALEMLSVDEACWLETHYLSNVTPLFFVETLADLEKNTARRRQSPEQIIRHLAEKTPPSAGPNVHHETLCQAELLGNYVVEMARHPIVGGGQRVQTEGKAGVFFAQAPEIMALNRWQAGAFLEVEREFAKKWRRLLSGLNLDAVYDEYRCTMSTFEAVKEEASRRVDRDGWRYTNLKLVLRNLNIPLLASKAIVARWKSMGGPRLREFAPYTAHVLTVDLFFNIAIGADLISRNRPSNKIDMAYLYYLPFCMVFVSNDNLHARTVPCFLTSEQVFIRGEDFKADLGKLNQHYSQLPEEVRERGVMSFADRPPHEGFLVTELWDKLMREDWRVKAKDIQIDGESEAKLVDHMTSLAKAARREEGSAPPLSSPADDFMLIEHSIPVRMGSWRLVSPEAEKEVSN